MSPVDPQPTTARNEEVYDGRTRLGMIRDLGRGYATELASGERIGVFENRRRAFDFILQAVRAKTAL